jgi:hypothetical protein
VQAREVFFDIITKRAIGKVHPFSIWLRETIHGSGVEGEDEFSAFHAGTKARNFSTLDGYVPATRKVR